MKTVLAIVVILIFLLIVGCGAPATPEPTPVPTVHPGKSLVSSRCVGCHPMNRVENAAYDEKGWQLTVDRMVLLGAEIPNDQAPVVVDYLAQAFPKE